jgi:hypothetical protein
VIEINPPWARTRNRPIITPRDVRTCCVTACTVNSTDEARAIRPDIRTPLDVDLSAVGGQSDTGVPSDTPEGTPGTISGKGSHRLERADVHRPATGSPRTSLMTSNPRSGKVSRRSRGDVVDRAPAHKGPSATLGGRRDHLDVIDRSPIGSQRVPRSLPTKGSPHMSAGYHVSRLRAEGPGQAACTPDVPRRRLPIVGDDRRATAAKRTSQSRRAGNRVVAYHGDAAPDLGGRRSARRRTTRSVEVIMAGSVFPIEASLIPPPRAVVRATFVASIRPPSVSALRIGWSDLSGASIELPQPARGSVFSRTDLPSVVETASADDPRTPGPQRAAWRSYTVTAHDFTARRGPSAGRTR